MFHNLFRAEDGLECRSLENGNSKHLNPTGCRLKTVKSGLKQTQPRNSHIYIQLNLWLRHANVPAHINVNYWTAFLLSVETVSYFKSEGPASSLKSGGWCLDTQVDTGDSDLFSSSTQPLIFWFPVNVTCDPSESKSLDTFTHRPTTYQLSSFLLVYMTLTTTITKINFDSGLNPTNRLQINICVVLNCNFSLFELQQWFTLHHCEDAETRKRTKETTFEDVN